MWQVQVSSISWKHLARNIKELILFQRQPFDCMWWKYSRAALISWIFQGTSDRRFSSLSGGTKKILEAAAPSLSYWVFYRRTQWFQFQLWHFPWNMMQFESQNCTISKHTYLAILFNSAISAHGIRVNDNQCCQQVFTSWEMLKRNYCCFQGFAF